MASSATSQFGLFLFAASIGTLLLTMAPQFGTALECLTLSGPHSQTPFGTKQCEADEEYCGTVRCQKIKSMYESRGCFKTGMTPEDFCNMARSRCYAPINYCNICQTDKCNNETRVFI